MIYTSLWTCFVYLNEACLVSIWVQDKLVSGANSWFRNVVKKRFNHRHQYTVLARASLKVKPPHFACGVKYSIEWNGSFISRYIGDGRGKSVIVLEFRWMSVHWYVICEYTRMHEDDVSKGGVCYIFRCVHLRQDLCILLSSARLWYCDHM